MAKQFKFTDEEFIPGKLKGHLALLAANIIWGGMAPISKDLLNTGLIDGWSLSGLRIIGGAVLFWLLSILLPGSTLPKEKLDRKDIIPLFFASLLVIAANQALTIMGMSYTSPVDATVVCSMTPIFTLVLGFIFLKQKLNWLKVVGVVLGFIGVLAFIFAGQEDEATNVTNPMLGNTLCFIAQFCGACYLVFFTDIIQKYSAFTLMKWMFLMSAICIFPFTITGIIAVDWIAMPFTGVLDALYIVILATCLAYLLTPIAQKHVHPTVVAMYNYLQPVVAAVISILAGLAIVDIQTALYAFLIFTGVWLVSKN